MVFAMNADASCGSSVRAAALAGAGPQASGCRQACPAGCNRIQALLCHSEQGYRCFAALNMTVAAALRKEVNDKRSAVKNLSTYTFIQILRRSSDLLRMTMLSLH